MIDYVQILSINYPGKEWTFHGKDYSGLNWLDTAPKPTQTELDALWADTQTALYNKSQKDARSNAYRNESDPIYFKWQRGEATEEDWKDAISIIQARYPYETLK